MPRRAPRYCTAAGCNQWATPDGRCSDHLLPRPKPRPRPRPSSSALGYDRRWRTLSEQIRRARPVCEQCGTQPSRHVDHIDNDRSNTAPGNLRALCSSCHSRKTARVDGGFGNTRR